MLHPFEGHYVTDRTWMESDLMSPEKMEQTSLELCWLWQKKYRLWLGDWKLPPLLMDYSDRR